MAHNIAFYEIEDGTNDSEEYNGTEGGDKQGAGRDLGEPLAEMMVSHRVQATILLGHHFVHEDLLV